MTGMQEMLDSFNLFQVIHLKEDLYNVKFIVAIEGWILFITGLHEEAQDDDIYEAFADYGQIKNMHINLDRRTGYLKGYGMIEYERLKEAETAIENMNGKTILGKTIQVDFAFKKPRGRGRA